MKLETLCHVGFIKLPGLVIPGNIGQSMSYHVGQTFLGIEYLTQEPVLASRQVQQAFEHASKRLLDITFFDVRSLDFDNRIQ